MSGDIQYELYLNEYKAEALDEGMEPPTGPVM